MRIVFSRLISFLTLLTLILTACTRATPTPAPTLPTASPTAGPTATATAIPPSPTPPPTATLVAAQFIGSACPFKLPSDVKEGQTIRCGYLSVPANRQDPNAGTLQLAVAILSPEDGATQPEPIIYLEGGPGGSALEFLYLTYERNFKPILSSGRQIILFDQRGVGLSRPALDCPEQDKLFYELLDNEMNGRMLTEEEMDQLNADAMETCARNLRTRADLRGFSTDENAADVVDLARALGFDQVNLWGVSYGTRLGLEVLRDTPDIIRSALLDSNVPVDANLYAEQPANMVRSFDLLFESCTAEEACNSAYPDLRQIFFDTVDRLNEQPAEFNAQDPIGGQSYKVVVNGDNFIDLMFQFMYDAEIVPLVPRLIANASQDNFDLLALLVGSVIATHSAISQGMHFVLQCSEEIGFTSPEEVKEAGEDYPEFEDYFDQSFANGAFQICSAMELERTGVPDANKAVSSNAPVMVMAGEFDPVTPPTWSEQVAKTLENSYLYEYPGLSHGASFEAGCPQEMALAFFANPSQKPDAACIDEMGEPAFAIPVSSAVEMEPFSNDAMSIQGVRPAGWRETQNPGVFSRQSSSLDVALIMIQAASTTTENLLAQYTRQFGLQATPASNGEREANRLTWKLYSIEVRNLPIEMALAQSGDQAIMVLLQSTVDERDALVEFVYLPVIDSVKPLK